MKAFSGFLAAILFPVLFGAWGAEWAGPFYGFYIALLFVMIGSRG